MGKELSSVAVGEATTERATGRPEPCGQGPPRVVRGTWGVQSRGGGVQLCLGNKGMRKWTGKASWRR